jgi:hypothetical protein
MLNNLRIFTSPKFPVLSLGACAQIPEAAPRERSQFHLLLLHSLTRFFNNELISAEGEAKARLFQVLHAIALPGVVVVLFLCPLYHRPIPRLYWAKVSDHYFYVVFPFVALGVLSIFSWDLVFPDLLDVNVLAPLPIRRLFAARVLAATLFLGFFVAGVNLPGAIFYPWLTEQPGFVHRVFVQAVAGMAGAAFTAFFFLALQGILISVLGERIFRAIAPFLQAIATTILLMVLLLFPAISQFLAVLLPASAANYFPPFWFLGMYEVLLDGSSTLPVFRTLAMTGSLAIAISVALVAVSYPLAYRRKMRYLVEGSGRLQSWRMASSPWSRLLHATLLRNRVQRGIYHFISYSLLRTQRYRVYLAMYGGLGLALLVTCSVYLTVHHGQLGFALSLDGTRAALPIAAFWIIAGLRTAFLSATDRRGSWVFRVSLGRPGPIQLETAALWIFPCALVLTMVLISLIAGVGPQELRGAKTFMIQAVTAIGVCMILTDVFFLNVTSLPFTGEGRTSTNNLAWILLQYFGLFPPLILLVLALEPWLAASAWHLVMAVAVAGVAHRVLHSMQKKQAEYHANLIDLDGDEEEFPQRLGLRY